VGIGWDEGDEIVVVFGLVCFRGESREERVLKEAIQCVSEVECIVVVGGLVSV